MPIRFDNQHTPADQKKPISAEEARKQGIAKMDGLFKSSGHADAVLAPDPPSNADGLSVADRARQKMMARQYADSPGHIVKK